MQVLNTNTRYLYDTVVQYAERLTATLPDPLRVCFFVNSGSEANELALRLARTYTRQRGIVVLEEAYHGNTRRSWTSPVQFNGPGGKGPPPWVTRAGAGRVSRRIQGRCRPAGRGEGRGGRGVASTSSFAWPRSSRRVRRAWPDNHPSRGLSPECCRYRSGCRRCLHRGRGANCIRLAWPQLLCVQTQRVVPDVVVLGKPIGNGHPIGAVITTPAIAESFHNGMEFFSTFGGNAVSCAVGLAVLDVVAEGTAGPRTERRRQDDQWLARARGPARVNRGRWRIRCVRRRGARHEPYYARAGDCASGILTNRMREDGILLGTEGRFSTYCRFARRCRSAWTTVPSCANRSIASSASCPRCRSTDPSLRARGSVVVSLPCTGLRQRLSPLHRTYSSSTAPSSR